MKKGLNILLKIFIVLVVILLTGGIGSFAGILYTRWTFANREIINESGEILVNIEKESGEEVVLEEKVTCLFMGASGSLTDFIMLGQYNPNTREINLLSIPRDTYVKGTVDGKINSAYAGVDPQRTVDKVTEITGIDIDYYVLFKTKLLRELVDEIDGVTVEVPVNMNYDDPAQNLHIHLKKGTYKLNGAQAEQFCRFRRYPTGDIGRIKAQQSFIKAMIFRCIEPQNLLKIGKLIDIVMENTKTNITSEIAKEYIDDAIAFKGDRIRIETLPGVSGTGSNKLSYWYMDEEKSKELIDDMFNKETKIAE